MANQALPQTTARLLEQYLAGCRHLGLILDKYAPWQPVRSRGEAPAWDLVVHRRRRSRDERPLAITGGEAKGIWLGTPPLSRQSDETPGLFEEPRADNSLVRAQHRRWANSVDTMGGTRFEMTSRGRLLVGLGASHVLETALALDRTSGAPFIPGSSLKGLTRAYGLYVIAQKLGISIEPGHASHEETAPLQALDALLSQKDADPSKLERLARHTPTNTIDDLIDGFRTIFGTQGQAGHVCFIDAVYAGQESPVFVADVMTPHFAEYYTGGRAEPPRDDQNPNPISFLSVEAKSTFAFGLVPRNPAQPTQMPLAVSWLRSALTELGVGGKTAAGYGYFEDQPQNS